ncbi:CLUMA_CG010691, isoform A [Clunio marinus]|uniref:CLUMA_CG010691, isoform A n=1 Tax=Clunio marinus TaxID=568069 RepID=A0A1J1IAL0_9DIPT|nr:CLUMA_CG010691, isoform A [Clunio marinus]
MFKLNRDMQKKFPIDNLAEWNHNNNPLGLRCMQVYVLVFDMGNLETFQYCRSIREQILSSFTHRNFSIMVVGTQGYICASQKALEIGLCRVFCKVQLQSKRRLSRDYGGVRDEWWFRYWYRVLPIFQTQK